MAAGTRAGDRAGAGHAGGRRRLPVGLHDCDQEPIHAPGLIQPHGAPVAFRPGASGALAVCAGSANAAAFLGVEPRLQGTPAALGLTPEIVAALSDPNSTSDEHGVYPVVLDFQRGALFCDAIVHSHDGVVMLEFERRSVGRDVLDGFALKAHRGIDALRRQRSPEALLAQAIGNLLGHARHHGDPSAPIRIVARVETDSVRVDVRDLAEPIPEETVRVLFRPFESSPDAAGAAPRRHRGLGLGLYIAHQIVQGHHGELAYAHEASEVVFSMRIPTGQRQWPSAGTAQRPHRRSHAAAAKQTAAQSPQAVREDAATPGARGR